MRFVRFSRKPLLTPRWRNFDPPTRDSRLVQRHRRRVGTHQCTDISPSIQRIQNATSSRPEIELGARPLCRRAQRKIAIAKIGPNSKCWIALATLGSRRRRARTKARKGRNNVGRTELAHIRRRRHKPRGQRHDPRLGFPFFRQTEEQRVGQAPQDQSVNQESERKRATASTARALEEGKLA